MISKWQAGWREWGRQQDGTCTWEELEKGRFLPRQSRLTGQRWAAADQVQEERQTAHAGAGHHPARPSLRKTSYRRRPGAETRSLEGRLMERTGLLAARRRSEEAGMCSATTSGAPAREAPGSHASRPPHAQRRGWNPSRTQGPCGRRAQDCGVSPQLQEPPAFVSAGSRVNSNPQNIMRTHAPTAGIDAAWAARGPPNTAHRAWPTRVWTPPEAPQQVSRGATPVVLEPDFSGAGAGGLVNTRPWPPGPTDGSPRLRWGGQSWPRHIFRTGARWADSPKHSEEDYSGDAPIPLPCTTTQKHIWDLLLPQQPRAQTGPLMRPKATTEQGGLPNVCCAGAAHVSHTSQQGEDSEQTPRKAAVRHPRCKTALGPQDTRQGYTRVLPHKNSPPKPWADNCFLLNVQQGKHK